MFIFFLLYRPFWSNGVCLAFVSCALNLRWGVCFVIKFVENFGTLFKIRVNFCAIKTSFQLLYISSPISVSQNYTFRTRTYCSNWLIIICIKLYINIYSHSPNSATNTTTLVSIGKWPKQEYKTDKIFIFSRPPFFVLFQPLLCGSWSIWRTNTTF